MSSFFIFGSSTVLLQGTKSWSVREANIFSSEKLALASFAFGKEGLMIVLCLFSKLASCFEFLCSQCALSVQRKGKN